MRLGCDRDLRMRVHDMAEQGRSRPGTSHDEHVGIHHWRMFTSFRSNLFRSDP